MTGGLWIGPSLGVSSITLGSEGGLPPAPPGYGYLFEVVNGVNQLITITDANGVTRPIYVLGGS